jgi:RNA polymerase sigma factor (sigma-70 family)
VNWGKRHFYCDEHTLLDAYQDSLIIFYKKVTSGELTQIDKSFDNYLIGIGWRILNKKQIKSRNITLEEDFTFAELTDDPVLNQIISGEIDNEKQQALKAAVEKLGKMCRQLLTLFYFEGYDTEEITDIMEYPNKNTTSASKARCLNQLKEQIVSSKLFY